MYITLKENILSPARQYIPNYEALLNIFATICL